MKTGFSIGNAGYGGNAGAYRRVKAAGYDCIDYDALANTKKHPAYGMEDAAFAEFFRRERECIEQAGLYVYQTHGAWRYHARDGTEEERAERFEKMARGIWATELLGAKYFVIHPIMPFGAESGENPQGVWELNLEFMTRLAAVGEAHGVVVCLENMPMLEFPLSKPDAVLDLVKEINSPFMRVCLDTGHCAVHEGVTPQDAVRMTGREYLAVLHVHDNDGKGDRHWYPFSGVIDWEAFRNALHETGFDGVISIENAVEEMLHMPEELRAHYEKGLAMMAKYLAAPPQK